MSSSLGPWLLLLRQLKLVTTRLCEHGIMVCRMDLQTFDGKSVMDEEAHFQLLFWSLQAIVSLFRSVQVGATITASVGVAPR